MKEPRIFTALARTFFSTISLLYALYIMLFAYKCCLVDEGWDLLTPVLNLNHWPSFWGHAQAPLGRI